jgi:hypothetical protein
MWTAKLYSFFGNAFKAPFRSSAWVVLIYVIVSVIYHNQSNFNRWVLPDTDDYIRFVQVFNWIKGQSWYDLSLPHLFPQHVITMHWARLPDIPLAAIILALQGLRDFFRLNMSMQDMAFIAAFVWPLVLFMALLAITRHNARALLGPARAGVTAFIVIIALQLMFQFVPMRVDHHAYVLLFAGTAFFALQNMLLGNRHLRMAVLAAGAMALGLWNGAEILPMLALFSVALTVIMGWRTGAKGRARFLTGLVFGLSLLAFSGLLLMVVRRPDEWLAIEYDAFSFFYVLIAGFTAAYFTLLYLVAQVLENRAVRAAAIGFIAMTTLWGFLWYFPDFVLGPYAKANPLLNTLFFPNIREAVPFTQAWAELGDAFGLVPQQTIGGGLYYVATRLFVPMVGIGACLYGLLRKGTSRRQQALWALYTSFVVTYTLLMFFWQVRVITYAQMFAIPPVTWLMLTYLSTLKQHYTGRSLYMWENLTVFAFTVFPVMVVPAILAQSKFMPDMLFYLGKGIDMPCMKRDIVRASIRQIEQTEGKDTPKTILAPMDYTPEFMFYSNQNFIAAPYHRNDRGIIAMTSFFRSRGDDKAARRVAKELDLDYVIVCKPSFFQVTLNREASVNQQHVHANGGEVEDIVDEKALATSSLGARLAKGMIPQWLEPYPLPFDKEFAMFSVDKKKLDQATRYPKESK